MLGYSFFCVIPRGGAPLGSLDGLFFDSAESRIVLCDSAESTHCSNWGHVGRALLDTDWGLDPCMLDWNSMVRLWVNIEPSEPIVEAFGRSVLIKGWELCGWFLVVGCFLLP